MATITAAQNGNWSATSTWTGGVVPVDGDSVKAGTFTITFDVDINQPNTVLEATTGNFRHSGTGTRNVTANANVGNGTHATAAMIQNTSTGTLNFYGEVKGGIAMFSYGAINTSTGTLYVTTATGGTGSSASGARNTGAGTLTVGTAIGGTGVTAHGVVNESTGTANVDLAIGNAGGPGSAVLNSASGVEGRIVTGQVTKVKRIQFGAYGMTPVVGPVLLEADSTNSAQFRTVLNGATKTLTDSAVSADYPTVGNVRSGTVYANGDRTGTLAVPAANQVAVGVAVDSTTGTAVLTQANAAAAVWNATRSSYTTDGTFGDVAEWAGSIDTGAIATAVRGELATELGRIDATVSSRLAANAYTTPPTVGAIADAVWDEALSGHTASGSTGQALTSIDTQLMGSAASIAAGLSNDVLTIYRGDTWGGIIVNAGNISARTALYWTVKADTNDPDANATIQVSEAGGLLRLNGAATTAGNGSIVVTNATTGDITFRLQAAATAALPVGQYVWDVQMVTALGVTTLGTGIAYVTADVTRATS